MHLPAFFARSSRMLTRPLACVLSLVLAATSAVAGVHVVGSSGITTDSAPGVTYTGTNGFVATGTDGALAFAPNGMTAPWTSGITFTGADTATFAEPAGLFATNVDSASIASADSFAAAGLANLIITDGGGTQYQADSVLVRQPNGITFTGADGITFTGADGITFTGADSGTIVSADGVYGAHPTGITFTGADGITAVGPNGETFTVSPDGASITGVDGITFTGADGITFTGADTLQLLGLDGLPIIGTVGLQTLDPELADRLDRITDDSNVDAAIVFHHAPTNADIADLVSVGILGGTRYKVLPVVMVTTTKRKLVMASHLPAVRAIYGNRTLSLAVDNSRVTTGASRVPADADLTAHNSGVPLTGAGVTVAVLDTGVNGLHADLAGRVAQNVTLLDMPGAPIGFSFPIDLENQLDTDLVSGHGTFVGGIIAGNGTASGGRIRGVAPGARVVGLSAGLLDLPHVLAGFDYVLDRGPSLGIRVLNCSFSAGTVFDVNDPVNVATRLLHDQGVSVVFSAGNTGPGWNTLNPYAAAPWVIGVGATDDASRLAAYSSRGAFGSALFKPTLVAPGTSVVSLRSSPAVSVTGALGIESGGDLQNLSLSELPFYTTASGTSFSAPQVAGTIALMLEANPALTPDEIKDILQRTATPLPPNLAHEAGAGMLNAHAAALDAAFAGRRMGAFRAALGRGQVSFVIDDSQGFSATVTPTGTLTRSISIPADTVQASVQIAWGPITSTNDLGLSLFDPAGVKRANSNALNLPGLTGKREHATLESPAPGTWQVQVRNSLSLLGTPQPVTAKVDIARVVVAPLTDIASLSATSRTEVQTCIRTYMMFPYANRFRPTFKVSRCDLAQSLVLAGRVPQYLPATPHYPDLTDHTTEVAVESAQAFAPGALFPDAAPGSPFHPDAAADRLTAAVALVRAAGYRTEAEQRAGTQLSLADNASIPAQLRGYVAVALERDLMVATGNAFRPADALVRSELAHALATLLNVAAAGGLTSARGPDTVGVYVASTAGWFLRFTNTPGAADSTFGYGSAGSGFVALTGDWNGDGTATPGLYDPASGAFFLRNSNTPGGADVTFTFGPGGAGLVPLAGDWDGDGIDTVGLYNPVTGTFFLRNWLASGPADVAFNFGAAGGSLQPLAGDWNGDGVKTVGLFDPGTATFFLKDTNGPGPADSAFSFGVGGSGQVALAGDWDFDGVDTIGLFQSGSATVFLRDTNAGGSADSAFNFGPAGAEAVVGHWNG